MERGLGERSIHRTGVVLESVCRWMEPESSAALGPLLKAAETR